jgi:hypothetical protein
MNQSAGFQFDEISVFTEEGIKYCVPTWAYQSDLNVKVDTDGLGTSSVNLFNEWSKTQKFPLFCSFDLPDGIYSTYLFKLCHGAEKLFGVDVSHYEYKGKNPTLVTMKLPAEDCPFDEMLPVPKQESIATTDNGATLKSECAHLEFLLEGEINESGMRRTDSSLAGDFKFHFQKYLYN